MPKLTSGNQIVDEMAQISIKGNVIPQEWYKHVTRKNGKPHLLAISILGDVVYWHRPTELRDENTGYIIGWKKKFKGDRLQKTYKYYSNMFGESKDSVKAAFDVLVEIGVIVRDFEDIEHADGTYSSNVMYIDIVPERLRDITFGYDETDSSMGSDENEHDEDVNSDFKSESRGDIPQNNQGVPQKFSGRVPKILDQVAENNEGAPIKQQVPLPENFPPYPPENPDTYTNNNTNTVTDNESDNKANNYQGDYPHSLTSFVHSDTAPASRTDSGSGYPLSERTSEGEEAYNPDYDYYKDLISTNIEYDRLIREHCGNKKLINRILKVLVDTVCSKESHMFVARADRPIEEIRARYLALDHKLIEHVLYNLPEDDSDVGLKDKFLMAYLFNAKDTAEQICRTEQMHKDKGKGSFSKIMNREYDFTELERELLAR